MALQDAKSFDCKKCVKEFSSRYHLERHLKTLNHKEFSMAVGVKAAKVQPLLPERYYYVPSPR